VLTEVLATLGAEVVAVEIDPILASKLRQSANQRSQGGVKVVNADFLRWELPTRPFRVMGNLAFGSTTAILHRLFDQPEVPLIRADLIVQWEVARKRSHVPPSTLVSTTWAPWWEFELGRRIPASKFRPIPSVDGGVLRVIKRTPPLLPPAMAGPYALFVRRHWPFAQTEEM
jgi:23S rRNA (adenine-N6)-dimethyltransferase